jgi:hypothetical protein
MIKIIDSVNIKQATNKKVVSFCLFHNTNTSRDYLSGVFVNRELMKKIYPDWIMRVYIKKDYPLEGIAQIKKCKDIELIVVDTNTCFPAMRFLPFDDKDVSVWISRDLDSVVNYREAAAVKEWLTSDHTMHIMSDHPHHRWSVACGMFGIKNDKSFCFLDKCEGLPTSNNYTCDAVIAEKIFFNAYKNSYIQHHSAGKKLKNNYSFPKHEEIDCGFVGSICHNMKDRLKLL